MPEETAKALKDGWLYSGDTGFIDEDGHLVVFDRTKDIMILSDGRKFSPQFLEARLKFTPYLRDALTVGDERPYVTAILCIDYNTVGKWAEDHGINYTSYPELSQNPALYDLVWNLSDATLLFFSTNKKALVLVEELFKETFGLSLILQIPWNTAGHVADQACLARLEQLRPEILL